MYDTNPRHHLDQGYFDMITLWQLFQGSDYGVGHLPDSGGVMEQTAIMMDAFAIMNKAEAELKKRE